MGPHYVAWVCRRHRAILFWTAALVAIGGLGASRLELRAGFEELLPTGDPRVAALAEVERRLGQFSSLVVLVRSPERGANRAYAQALGARLEAEFPSQIEAARSSVPEIRAFFETHRWLYADLALLQGARDRIRYDLLRARNPLYVELDEPPSLDAVRARLDRPRGQIDRLPGGWFESPRGDVVALVLLPARNLTSADDERLVQAARQAIAELPPPRGVVAHLGGAIAAAVEERRAIEEDMLLTSLVVIGLVGLAVGVYFGRLRALPLMALPALVGVTVAFGVAGVAFGSLNASTAFLGSIIAGNGINYPILLLARYHEERRGQRPVAEALETALLGTTRATALAAFAASAAYGSLSLTRFRGFHQFGIIGAVGMALCWAATMTVLPALLWALDRHRATAPRRGWRVNFGAPFARAAERAPRALLLLFALLSVGAAVTLARWIHDPLEYDLDRLRTTHVSDGRDEASLDDLFGRALSPAVLLAPDAAEADRAAAVVRSRAAAMRPSPVDRVITLSDLLPGAPEEQREKIEILDQIRRLLDDPALSALPEDERNRIDDLRPPPRLATVDATDLPSLARRPFLEKNGTFGTVVLVYPPRFGFSITDGRDLIRLANAISDVPTSRDRAPLQATGRAVIFAAMLQSIAHDGPRATLASIAAVALLTLIVLRGRSGALLVLATLGLGVLWMLGIAALFDVRINFLNFVALPITFGIGIDYSANLYFRYRAEGSGSIGRVLATTGGAVALNSLTTMIGYGSLLVAHNRALVSFGALAILGELACLVAALVVLPSLLVVRDRKKAASLATLAERCTPAKTE